MISLMLMVLTFISLSLFSVASSMPMIAVTMTDELIGDANMNNMADPGDTLEYTVSITNTRSSNATNVVFDDTIDANTTLSGTVHISPLAFKDSYTSLGNVGLNVPAGNGLLLNDADPDNNVSLKVVMVGASAPNTAMNTQFSTAQGGQATVQANGAFVYTPTVGFTGSDTFVYELSDGDVVTPNDVDTVTITVSDMIWFIDGNAGSLGDGRLGTPFNTLAAFEAVNGNVGVANPQAGHTIYLAAGTYSGSTVTLENNQKFIGQGATGALATIASITVPPHSRLLPSTGGSRPLITNAAGSAINLASGNTVHGVNIGTVSLNGLSGSNVGNLDVDDMLINASIGTGVNINMGVLDVTLDSVSSSGGVNGIVLQNTTGSFAVTGDGGGTTQGGNGSGGTIANQTGDAVILNNVTNITLRDMQISSPTRDGIDADELKGTTLFDQLTITDVDEPSTSAIRINNHLGAANLTGTISNSSFTNSTTGQSLVLVQFRGAIGTTMVNVNNNLWNSNALASFQINGYEGSGTQTSGTLNHTFSGNTVQNSTLLGTGDTNHSCGGSLTCDFDITNNTYRDLAKAGNFNAGVLNAGYGATTISGGTSMSLEISGNNVSHGVDGQGNRRGIGVVNEHSGGTIGSMDLLVDNNNVDDMGDREALYISNREPLTTFDVKITRNDFGTGAIVGTTAGNIGGTRDGVFIENRGGTTNILFGGSAGDANTIQADNSSNDSLVEIEGDDGGNVNVTMIHNGFSSSGTASVEFETTSDGGAMCVDLKNNTNSNTGTEWLFDGDAPTTIRVEGAGVAAATQGQLQSAPHNNTGAFSFTGTTPLNNNNTNCTEPTIALAPTGLDMVQAPADLSVAVEVVETKELVVSETGGRPQGLASFAQSGETINQSIVTMEPGQVVAIVFQATVDNSLNPVTANQVCNQANVTATGGIDVDSDDPDTGAADDTTCTALADGTIVIIQNTDPDAAADFGYSSPGLPVTSSTLDDDADGTLTNTQTITGVTPGGYEITQIVSSGYLLSALTCDDGSSGAASTTNQASSKVTANVEPGETVTCTFTNQRIPVADLSITNTDGQTTAIPGEVITYTRVISNAGPDDVIGATASGVPPADLSGVTWTCMAGTGASCSNASGSGKILLESVDLMAGSSLTFTLSGLIDSDATGTLSNIASISVPGTTADHNPGNNNATDNDTVLVPTADLSISKTDSADPILAGDTLTYTVTVTNSGPSDATNVVVTEALPAGVTFVSTSGCAEDPTSVPTCTLGTIAASGNVSFTVVTTVDAPTVGTITNTVSVSTSATDPIGSNDTFTETTEVVSVPEIAIAGDVQVAEGDSGTVDMVFTISRTHNSVLNTVDVATRDVTASDASDYTAVPTQTITFPAAGPLTQTVTVTVNSDTNVEPDETLELVLVDPINGTLGDDVAVGTISNDDSATVTLTGGGVKDEADSGTTTRVFTATLNSAIQGGFDIAYTTDDGTATTADSDYVDNDGSLSFAGTANETQTITVTINGDTKVEADETFTVTLGALSGSPLTSTISTTGSPQVGTITNDDTANIYLSGGSAQAEGNSGTITYTFTITSDGVVDSGFNLAVQTVDGTATAADGDYQSYSQTLNVPGLLGNLFNVVAFGDTKGESDEAFTFSIGPVSNTILTDSINIIDSPQTATILNDDPGVFSLSTGSPTTTESTTMVPVTVTLSAPETFTTTVDYGTMAGTATAGNDYTETSGTLTFAPGETEKTFDIPILDDTISESDETLTVSLTNPVSTTLGNPFTATLTIVDDEAAPEIAFSSSAVSGDESGGTIPVTVTLDHGSVNTITVMIQSADVTATAGSDYTAISQTVTFAPGELSQIVDVSVLDDGVYEGDETLMLTLSSPISATLGNPYTATVTIVDDEAPPTVRFASSTVDVGESDGTLPITITLDHASTSTVTVMVQSADGTPISISSATAGSDYTTISQTITFEPGETSQIVNVVILPDGDDEPNEEFSLTLSDPSNSSLGLPSTVVITIVDDDDPPSRDETAIFLPMTNRSKAPGPDLIVESIEVVNGSVQLTIKNVGNVPVNNAFWVDLFINPTVLPTQANDTIGALDQDGLVWGIDPALIPLESGESLTLTPGDSSFAAPFSTFSGTISAGDLLVAHVDSANTTTTYGAVNESHEMSGGVYNNITSTPAPAVATVPDFKIESEQR